MQVQKIKSYEPTFGIYQKTKLTHYGQCNYGVFRDKKIQIYTDNIRKIKLYYLSDSAGQWIKSKLVYFQNGIKKIVRSESKNR